MWGYSLLDASLVSGMCHKPNAGLVALGIFAGIIVGVAIVQLGIIGGVAITTAIEVNDCKDKVTDTKINPLLPNSINHQHVVQICRDTATNITETKKN